MFDIEKLLDDIRNFAMVREFPKTNFVTVALPVYHPGNDESIAVGIRMTEDGRPVFTDCGTTADYLELNYLGINHNPERVAEVCERYGLKIEDKEVVMELPTDTPDYVLTAFCSFVGALSILANIDIK